MAKQWKYVVRFWAGRNMDGVDHPETSRVRAMRWAREAVREGYQDQASAQLVDVAGFDGNGTLAEGIVARWVNVKGKAVRVNV